MQSVINDVDDRKNVKLKNGTINSPSSAWLKYCPTADISVLQILYCVLMYLKCILKITAQY
jgi:hypothetical protein